MKDENTQILNLIQCVADTRIYLVTVLYTKAVKALLNNHSSDQTYDYKYSIFTKKSG